MTTSTVPSRVRRNIDDVYSDWITAKNPKPLNDLMRAFRGIQALDPTNNNSFFKIAGYHGMPFRGAGYGNPQWWGGYCHHGNVLFPTWHRAYLLRLEDALRSIKDCEDVTLPFWDEYGDATKADGLPAIFTSPSWKIDGQDGPNPLYSYKFQRAIHDTVPANPQDVEVSTRSYDYSKPKNYETKRYPLSGLEGPDDIAASDKHNANFTDLAVNTKLLNDNIKMWLSQDTFLNSEGDSVPAGTRKKYRDCLDAPNYTVFSCTTAAKEYNSRQDPPTTFVPLEWQNIHKSVNQLDIIPEFPGTNSVDSQGPTPGVPGGVWLDIDFPLQPFMRPNGPLYTSKDVVNIETQLGYTYDPKSNIPLGDTPAAQIPAYHTPVSAKVTGINKRNVRGSFILGVYGTLNGEEQLLGQESILSRWHIDGCSNCQIFTNVKRYIPLHGITQDHVDSTDFNANVKVITREGVVKDGWKGGSKLQPKLDLIVKRK